MSAFVRCSFRRCLPSRPLLALAGCGAAWFFSLEPLYAQSGMCAGGGTGSTSSVGATGTTTGGTSTAGATANRGAGAATSASNAIGLMQMAAQFQQMQQQAEYAQALQVMQYVQMQSDILRLEELEIEQQRAMRLANMQKRRALQAARAQERKTGKQIPRPEKPSSASPAP